MASETRSSLYFPLRTSRLTVLRDLAMVVVCVAFAATFVADLWRSAPPEAIRAAASAEQVVLRA